VDDHISPSDQIFNEAYNFNFNHNNKKRNKIDSFEDYDDIEPDWEKIEEALGEINESEWGRLFGIVPEMEIEPEQRKVIWQPWVVEPEKKRKKNQWMLNPNQLKSIHSRARDVY